MLCSMKAHVVRQCKVPCTLDFGDRWRWEVIFPFLTALPLGKQAVVPVTSRLAGHAPKPLTLSDRTSLDLQSHVFYILYRSSWRACERLGWWDGSAWELPSMLPDMREPMRQVATGGLSWIQDSAVHAMRFVCGDGRIALPVLKKDCSTIGLLCMPLDRVYSTSLSCVVIDGSPVDFRTTAAM